MARAERSQPNAGRGHRSCAGLRRGAAAGMMRPAMDLDALFRLHTDLPREAPGSDAATREALARLPPVPPGTRVLDIGCGPGRATVVLARDLNRPVTAVDIHQPYLDRTARAAAAADLGHLVITRRQSMLALDDPPGSVGLIWCEGAIYIAGFRDGLRLWWPLLAPGGLVVASDLVWLGPDRPAEAAAFWATEYPDMSDVAGRRAVAEAEGFAMLDHFTLPRAAWWDEYLEPLAARIERLRPEAAADPGLTAVLDEAAREITVCARHGDSFGYVVFLMRKRD